MLQKIFSITFLCFSLLAYLEADDYLETKPEAPEASSKVEVRAVFINCEPNDKRGMSSNEAMRFEREELFKHSALRNCEKKLALTVKMSSEPAQMSSDEYIPIEHVFDGSGKKRVRLLDPYVLRLRRKPPVQAYKLHKLETVNGVLINTADKKKFDKRIKNNKKGRLQRSVDESREEATKTIGCATETAAVNDDSLSSKNEVLFNVAQNCKRPDETLEKTNISVVRNKRYEQNIVINEEEPVWIVTDKIYPRSEEDNIDLTQNIFKRDKFDNNRNNKVNELFSMKSDWNNDFLNIANSKALKKSSQYYEIKKTDSPKQNMPAYDINHIDKRKYFSNTERDGQNFNLFKIGNPNLWHSVHVQLFEKVSIPGGKIAWKDLTNGEPAKLSSTNPEWTGQDFNIKYRSAEYLTRKDFTLPESNLCLVLPLRENEDSIPYNDNFFTNVNNSDLLVVQFDDIVSVNKGSEKHNKRDKKLSDLNISKDTSSKHKRRVLIRVSRALSSDSNMNLALEGSEHFLTLPYSRPHLTQMDIEARADENQLVHAGSSGRITVAVSDNTRKTRTTLTMQATNTGLAAARFRIKTRDCGPELLSWFMKNGNDGLATPPIVIPPRHTRYMNIEIPTEIPVDNVHCSVALINDDDESVAVRDVAIKKEDRCFCVWHCKCVCLGEDPKLLCKEMPESLQLAAGLTPRARPRHSREIKKTTCYTIDFLTAGLGVIAFLLCLSVVKAVLGLFFRGIGYWGLDKILQPRVLRRYRESSLKGRSVVYDIEGWPVHPDTKQRTVRVVNKLMEFMINLIFFIALPYMVLRNSCKEAVIICTNKPSQEDTDAKKGKRANKTPIKNDNKMKDVEKLRGFRPSPRRKIFKKWMTPQAEELTGGLWRSGLSSRGVVRSELMKPLICEELLHRDRVEYSSYEDSDQDDTEYVLTQMKKSKESLQRSQRKKDEDLSDGK